MSVTLAFSYAALCGLPVLMHLANLAGAPLGRWTMGGRFPGRLPLIGRGLALIQALLLIAMAAVVLQHAGVIALSWPNWLIWPVLTVTALSLLANAISPSRPERLLWTPILALMLACLIGLLLVVDPSSPARSGPLL